VVGAHLSGMALHHELLARKAEFVSLTRTAEEYRLHALAGGPPERPGLIRVPSGGRRIELEVYRLPMAEVGQLLSAVASPLAIGTIVLDSGESVHGFLCEPSGLAGAEDISAFGGWRAYREWSSSALR
jgi:allophanate hydrolase